MSSAPDPSAYATCDANEAVASVAYRLDELFTFHAIKSSATTAEVCAEWANSSFEDNGEFGLHLAVERRPKNGPEQLQELVARVGPDLVTAPAKPRILPP